MALPETADQITRTGTYFGSTLRAAIDEPCAIFNGNRTLYVLLAMLLFVCSVVLAFCAAESIKSWVGQFRFKRLKFICNPWAFLALMIATLLFCRWPAVTYFYFLGMDESLILSGAITLRHDPVFWQTVQTTTVGPLDYYPLLIAPLLGMPVDYADARIVDLAMVIGSLLFTFSTCRLLMDEFSARVAILPAWTFYALAKQWDYIQYTSEALPILILCAATYLSVRWIVRKPSRAGSLYVIGFLLGLLPFAKAQALPAGVAIAFSLMVATIRGPQRPSTGAALSKRIIGFIFCGALPTVLVLAFVAAYRLTPIFLNTYVRFQIDFLQAHRGAFVESFFATFAACFSVPDFQGFVRGLCIGIILAVIAALVLGRTRLMGKAAAEIRQNSALVCLLVLPPIALFYAIMARKGAGTAFYFYHYFLFLVIPWTIFLLKSVDWIRVELLAQRGGAAGWNTWLRFMQIVIVALPVAAQFGQITQVSTFLQPANYYGHDNPGLTAIYLLRNTKPQDALLVWGWRPDLYVETQLRQGISFASIEREMGTSTSGDTPYFRAQFMKEIRRSQPAAIVDTTGPADPTYTDRKYGHEVFPEFTDYINQNYVYVGDLEKFRIYLKKPDKAH